MKVVISELQEWEPSQSKYLYITNNFYLRYTNADLKIFLHVCVHKKN